MKRQRGVALIIALVVVALATVIATRIGADGARDQRRSATLLAQQQAFQVALGAEAWAAEVLRDDAERTRRDSLDEPWATPLPPLPVDGGSVQGGVEDLQGRFNLNNLLDADGTKNEAAFAQFRRLLELLQLEPKWASLVLDWIDGDTLADGIDGAEDGAYTGQTPPYRAANRPISSTSELLALPGFGLARYRRLQPFVAALPIGTPVNVCTASAPVLVSLAPGLDTFLQDAKQLAANRARTCFPLVADVEAALGNSLSAEEIATLRGRLSEQSTWFRVTTVVTIGTTQLTLYSLMRRSGPESRTVLRSFGTE